MADNEGSTQEVKEEEKVALAEQWKGKANDCFKGGWTECS